jgi:hypothetical protein
MQPCIDLAWLESSSKAEREASRKAWQVVPEGTIPWQSIDLKDLPIDTPKIPDIKQALPELQLSNIVPVLPLENFVIDGISLDDIPINSLPLDKIDIDNLIPDLPIDKPDLKNLIK